jgi:acyl carrier protein
MMSQNSDVFNEGLGDDPRGAAAVLVMCNQYSIETSDVYRGSKLGSDLGGTSVDLLELGIAIETNCGFEPNSIPEKVINSWKTAGQVVDYVLTNTSE